MEKIRFKIILLGLLFYISPKVSLAQCDEDDFMDECATRIDKFVFAKSFDINNDLSKKSDGKVEYSYVFSKGTSYSITVCDLNQNGNRMIVDLYDRNRKFVASSYSKRTKKYYPKITYPCNATGVYYLKYRFEGGKPSCGVSIIGFKK